MSIFESVNDTTDKMLEAGETYVKKTEAYYKLKIFQQFTVSISFITKALLIGGLLFIGLLFLALAAAIGIGKWLDNASLGYLIVAGVFLIMTTFIYYKRGLINNKIIKILAPKFFD